jgi:UDP-N-acetylmuramoylalanine--D-glutamate ligase
MEDHEYPAEADKTLREKRITIMGLGLHGGGAAAARYCALRGADVTVTDLRTAEVLKGSLDSLSDVNLRFILGEHRPEDFLGADIIVKNPAVPRSASFLTRGLEAGAELQTDIGLFLDELARFPATAAPVRVTAVTGTKGKSSTASAIHYALGASGRNSFLGGNITISPLSLIEDIRSTALAAGPDAEVHVVLELSSFQIGDLRMVLERRGRQEPPPLMPVVSVLTNIMPDHQDYYPDMASYVADKAALFSMTRSGGTAVLGRADQWSATFENTAASRDLEILSPQRPGSIDLDSAVPPNPLVPGKHQRGNFALAALALVRLGLRPHEAAAVLERFPGVDHRLQFVGQLGPHRVYNDSAATIAEAARAAVEAFQEPVYLICGGSDKNLSLAPLAEALSTCRKVYLLAGSATETLLSGMDGMPPGSEDGAYQSIGAALKRAAADLAREDAPSVLLLSPGCASFGMFLNEFDRGRKFVAALKDLQGFVAPAPEHP